jgi:hypothetical protein
LIRDKCTQLLTEYLALRELKLADNPTRKLPPLLSVIISLIGGLKTALVFIPWLKHRGFQPCLW